MPPTPQWPGGRSANPRARRAPTPARTPTRSIAAIFRDRGGRRNSWPRIRNPDPRSSGPARDRHGRLARLVAARSGPAPAGRIRSARARHRQFPSAWRREFADLAERVLPCWRELVEDRETQVVAIAGHAGVNRVILCDCSERRSPICSELRSVRPASTSSSGGKTSRSPPSSTETAWEARRPQAPSSPTARRRRRRPRPASAPNLANINCSIRTVGPSNREDTCAREYEGVKTPLHEKTAKMQIAMLTQVNAAKRRCAMVLHERFAKAGSQQGRRRDIG